MALVHPPKKASRGLSGSTNCRESTYVWMLGWVCLSWDHWHSHISRTLYPFPVRDFGLGLFVDVLHGTVTETQMLFMSYRITLGAAVPETPVKFVYSVGLVMETVHSERGPRDVILARIAQVLQVMTVGRMGMARIGASHPVFGFQVFRGELTQGLLAKLVIAPGQPFEGHLGLIDLIASLAHGFTGQAVGDHAVQAQISVASRGNGHMLKRVEPGFGFKQTFESQAALFQ